MKLRLLFRCTDTEHGHVSPVQPESLFSEKIYERVAETKRPKRLA